MAAEIAGTRPRGHGLLAGIDQVGVDFSVGGERANAKQAVFRLQPHVHAFGDVIGHQRRQADAKVHVGAIGQLLGSAGRHLVTGPRHVSCPPRGWCAVRCVFQDVRCARCGARRCPAGAPGPDRCCQLARPLRLPRCRPCRPSRRPG
ncbi:hypothetical protein G6F50_015163 [Rhizopus delemar]|uniref:Uncharacterized protein n=1 Tax=Rhizopus delemar TaxID=936053 RepID=A0A9P6Y0L9_9FUNG|nr:hypothetical protein G6F50_015163 [Rhizopus delemar]